MWPTKPYFSLAGFTAYNQPEWIAVQELIHQLMNRSYLDSVILHVHVQYCTRWIIDHEQPVSDRYCQQYYKLANSCLFFCKVYIYLTNEYINS